MKVAFVFPGQGSQAVGMLSELAQQHSIVKDTFAQASNVLDRDLWEIVSQGPEATLNETATTQPAMLAAGVAVWRVWKEQNALMPAVMAGHSLGEYSALVCSGSLEFEDAIQIVSQRGQFMQDAVPAGEGAMAAILGLDDDQVRAVCEQSAQGEVVSAVNFNSPGQVVIAGNTAAVNRTVDAAKEAGAKRALLLPVSVPSHCQLMDSAAHFLAERLAKSEFNEPEIAVINNVDVASEIESADIRDALTRQLCNPVRWVEVIQQMAQQGVTHIVECGPGKVLAGLNKRIDKTMTAVPVFSPETLDKALQTLKS